jgi:hypothetical protein
MNFRPWHNADADTKHDAIAMLVVHGVLYFTNLALYMGLPPLALIHVLEGESLPGSIRLVLDISNHLRNHFILFYLPLTLALPWVDAFIYLGLRKQYGKTAGTIWLIAIFLLLLASLVFFAYGSTATMRD